MNKAQRKTLAAASSALSSFADEEGLLETQHEKDETVWQVVAARLGDQQSIIESIRDEEQEKYDNMPEGLQGSEKGDTMTEGIDYLTNAVDNLGEAIDLAEDADAEGTNEERATEIGEKVQEAIDELDNIG